MSDISDRNLKKHYQIMLILAQIFLTQLAIKLLKFSLHTTSASELHVPGKSD